MTCNSVAGTYKCQRDAHQSGPHEAIAGVMPDKPGHVRILQWGHGERWVARRVIR